MTVYQKILSFQQKDTTAFAVLVDPDKLPSTKFTQFSGLISAAKVDFVLVGGSTLMRSDFPSWLSQLTAKLTCPVICFPGSGFQLDQQFNATLFLSLVSSRNAEYLIGKQVEAAPILASWKQEAIATAYTLIGTEISSTAYITQSIPIPPDKSELVLSTCLAAELLGFQAHYLEGGSGSQSAISSDLVQELKQHLSKPIIVGGGIQSPNQASELAKAGADVIVIGTQIEQEMEAILDFATAIQV